MLTDERLREIWAQATGEREPLVYIVGQAMDAFARAVEREARREALEAAAAECDNRRGPIEIYNHGYPAMLECAAAIRALIDKEGT